MSLPQPLLDRRRFLALTAATLPMLGTLHSFAQAPADSSTQLVLHPDQPGFTIPRNFVGLSYETQQLSDPTFFSPENAALIAQFRALAPHGVLRLGGNTSDIGWWKPTPSTPQPAINVRPSGPGEPTAALAYAIEPAAITNLRAFLEATGWTCLYGINLGTNTPARAAEEAAFVAKTLGSAQQGGKLEYFQLGNEPDLFRTHLRDPATWTADLYFDQWLAQANAIRARVPFARFGLPDTAGNPDWYATIVDRLLQLHADARPHIAALSHHYYFGGPPSNPDVNIPRLLHHNPQVDKLAHDITAAATRLSAASPAPIPYRMTEGNTCYRGGKPGVSDVFAAALWSADYLLQLASFGYAGVNLHGGDGQMVANSLGGTLPGELLMPDPHAPHPRPFYTPIAHIQNQGQDQFVLEPVGYGMKFAQVFAGATIIPVDFNPGPVNATLYAAKRPNGQILLAFINKDATQPLPLPSNNSNWTPSLTLHAPSLTSREVYLDTSIHTRQTAIPPATAMIFGQID